MPQSLGVWICHCGEFMVAVLELAEREGFEPSVELHTLHSLSRRAPSASRSSLRKAFRLLLYGHVAWMSRALAAQHHNG